MSDEGERITQDPSAQPEVQQLPQIPGLSIGLTGLLLDQSYESYIGKEEKLVIIRDEKDPTLEEFWTLECYEVDKTPVISLYNQREKRILQAIINSSSYRIINEIKIGREKKEENCLCSLFKDKNGHWVIQS